MAQVSSFLVVAGTDPGKVNSCLEWIHKLGQFSLIINGGNLNSHQIASLLCSGGVLFFE